VGHITTTAECNVCHSTSRWVPATFDHATATGNCSSCHNGISATGKKSGHFNTSLQCDSCHTTNRWTPDIYDHAGVSYPGDHRGNFSCTKCHKSNSEAVSWKNSAYAPDCAGCHANDYESDEHKKYPGRNYNVSELRDCSGSCHEYTNSSLTSIRKSRNTKHRVNDGGW